MYCMRVFNKSYIVYYNVYHGHFRVLVKIMHIPQFNAISVSYMHIYVPIEIWLSSRSTVFTM